MSDTKPSGLSPAATAAASCLFIFFWASGFIAAKYGLPYAEPLTFLSLRFLIALAVLIPLTILWRADWPSSARAIGHVIVAGLLVQTIYLIGVYYGIYLGGGEFRPGSSL